MKIRFVRCVYFVGHFSKLFHVSNCNNKNFVVHFNAMQWSLNFHLFSEMSHAFREQMDSLESKSNQNCDSSSNSSHPAHQQSMKIINLSANCLTEIFDRLDFVSLFNVALASEYLRSAACIVYKQRFGSRIVCFYVAENQTHVYEYGRFIVIIGLKVCLQYLRCFGSLIEMLAICYMDVRSKPCEYLDQCLNKFCAETLRVIGFKNKPDYAMQHIGRPFENVSKVMVVGGNLGSCFPLFSQWFPNMHSLHLDMVRMDDRHIGTPFNHLLDLEIDINNGTRRNGFAKSDAINLLRMCPQLLILKIRMHGRQGMTMTTLLNMIGDNPLIVCLNVTMAKFCTAVNSSEIRRIANEHSALMEISARNYKFTTEAAVELIRQLNNLEMFRFQIDDPSDAERIVSRLDNRWHSSLQADNSNRCVVSLDR